MARRRHQESSSRLVGIGGLFGSAFGYVGTSIYFALGAIALYALGETPFLILAVGTVFVVTAWSYAEAAAAMPETSGVASFARRAFDPMTGFAAAWALLLDSVILVALTCSFVPHYLGVVWPRLQESPYDVVVGIGAVVILVALNILGLRESVRLSSVAAVLGLATLVLLLVVGLVALLKPGVVWGQIQLGVAPSWGSLLYALPFAAAAFTGLDAVASRAESALRPGRDMPLAINVVLPLIVVLSFGLGVVALSAMPVGSHVVPVEPRTGLTEPVPVVATGEAGVYALADEPGTTVVLPVERAGSGVVIPAQEPTGEVYEAAGNAVTRLYGSLLGSAYLQDPVMGLVASLPEELDWLKDLLRPWVALVIAASLLLAANAVIGGAGRIVYSLARHHQVPAWLGRVQPGHTVPYTGITLLGLAAAAVLIPGDPLLLIGLFGFGAMLAFTATHLSVIALRYREKGLGRPFVVPLNVRWRGAVLPLPAVAGAAATALIWVVMVVTHPNGRLVGFGWMAGGLLLYVVYRRSARRPLLRQPRETLLPATALSDVDYERILVPVLGTRLSDEMMVLGCQLATDKGAVIDVVYVIEVPMELALDTPLEEQRLRGRRVLDAALAVAAEFGVEAWPHLVAGRHPGRAIIDTAREWHADVIMLGAVRKLRTDDRPYGDSVAYILRHAPGEVLLNLVPADFPMQGSGAEIDAELAAAAAEIPPRAAGEGK